MVKPYGCHNTPRTEGYWARSTWHGSNPQYAPQSGWTWVVDTMTAECQYRKEVPNDRRCDGCTRP